MGVNKMLNVTDDAKQRLKEQLQTHTEDPDVGARLVVQANGQFGLVADRETPGDQVVEYDGLKVLLVGQESAAHVDGKTLDLQDTIHGKKLVVR